MKEGRQLRPQYLVKILIDVYITVPVNKTSSSSLDTHTNPGFNEMKGLPVYNHPFAGEMGTVRNIVGCSCFSLIELEIGNA